MTTAQASSADAPLLEVRGIQVVYAGAILAVDDVSFDVRPGEIVALLGANGAGKSTALKAVSGLIHADRAAVRRGDVRAFGASVLGVAPNQLVQRGIVHVLEGRHVFGHLTVEENLASAAFHRRPTRAALARKLEQVYTWFPRLATKRATLAGYTSGGEQQMLAIGRALLTQPRLILLDEPSMGLAPKIVHEIFEILARLNREQGLTLLIAEQGLEVALRHAHRGVVLASGRVVASGAAAELRARSDLHEAYVGVTA